MTHLDIELRTLKEGMVEMFQMVTLQMQKAKDSLIHLDKDLAHEVIVNEKRVNSFELKLDRDCENIFALFQPVAVDLRFVLACLKINSNLERTGDIAEGIARFALKINSPLDSKLQESTRLLEMFKIADEMMREVTLAFETEDTKISRAVFQKDERLDEINLNANTAVADFIKSNPERINQSLYVLSTVRKLERVGDQCLNIAEEIIFYLEAKVLKHLPPKMQSE